MNKDIETITIWAPSDVVKIPTTAESPDEIVKYASSTLSKRDIESILTGFKAQGYEMVSTFVWTKAAAALKRQVATLGMEFVGEMLGRPDLNEDSDPTSAISHHEVITLSEDLGMITPTQALRLKQSLELVMHYAQKEQPDDDGEVMQKEEAVSLLRTCIASILGKPRFETAVRFADFRRRLGENDLQPSDGDVTSIANSPYFFVRTTLSVLLSMVKGAKGATLEHAVGNTILMVKVLWERLRKAERYQIGQAYAEVNADGNRLASAGLKKALIDVHGFDYVPETLRSNTFTEAAARVLAAHFAFNNFYNEAEPMRVLANLGTAIPMPAFAKCIEATLAVKLGNRWGAAIAAQASADQVLDGLRPTQWEYYFNECLNRDRTILEKIAYEAGPFARWSKMLKKFYNADAVIKDTLVRELIEASISDKKEVAMQKASILRTRVGA